MSTKSKIGEQYAWNWFSYHASQRISAFNFFLIMSGAVGAAYFKCVEHFDDPLWQRFGVVVGVFGAIVSVAFIFLDVRNEELVNCGRKALDTLEKEAKVRACHQLLSNGSAIRDNALGGIVGKPSKWSVKLPRNRLRGHVAQQYLPNSVMDQNRTSGQLPEATSTGRALYGNMKGKHS